MKVYTSSRNFDGSHQGVMTIGIFDGIHIGHQKLIQRVVSLSKTLNTSSILYTLDPHPLELLSIGKKVKRLFPIEYMIEIVESLGVDFLIIENFSKKFSQLSSSDFVEEYICKTLKPSYLILGEDFRFGHSRKGAIPDLKEMGKIFKFCVETVAPVLLDTQLVSSSLVRKAFEESHFLQLSRLLGRPFIIKGQVISGKALGRQLGFPTANVDSSSYLLPKRGVYICWMKVWNKKCPAVMNFGVNPTVDSQITSQIEVHLLDKPLQPLQGQKVEIELLSRVRGEKQFDTYDQLSQAIGQDVQKAKNYFSSL